MKTKKYHEMANGIKCEKECKRTAGQTMWAVRCFQNWCHEHLGQTMDFSASSKTELNEELCKFYSTVKNGRGDPYGSSGFNGLRAGLNRHLSEPPLCWSIMKDSEFMPSNDVFLGIAKNYRVNLTGPCTIRRKQMKILWRSYAGQCWTIAHRRSQW